MAALTALLDGCANPGVSRKALLIDLATLPPALGRAHHLRLVAVAIDPLLGLDRARLFLTPTALVLIWRGEAAGTVEPAMAALRRLFADLPDTSALIQRLDLPQHGAVVAASMANAASADISMGAGAIALDATRLIGLETALAHTDVSPYARRRRVYRSRKGAAPKLAFEHRCLDIAGLVESVAPGVQPHADGWLFRRLTRTLDRRMLALLSHPGDLRRIAPFALNLNVASILAPEFVSFDGMLPVALRGKILLALDATDIVSDATSFEFAREFCHARDYRLILQPVGAHWLEVLPAASLGLDLIELRASAGGMALPSGCDPDALVLTGVDEPSLLQWGHANGISLFEGAAVSPR